MKEGDYENRCNESSPTPRPERRAFTNTSPLRAGEKKNAGAEEKEGTTGGIQTEGPTMYTRVSHKKPGKLSVKPHDDRKAEREKHAGREGKENSHARGRREKGGKLNL